MRNETEGDLCTVIDGELQPVKHQVPEQPGIAVRNHGTPLSKGKIPLPISKRNF